MSVGRWEVEVRELGAREGERTRYELVRVDRRYGTEEPLGVASSEDDAREKAARWRRWLRDDGSVAGAD